MFPDANDFVRYTSLADQPYYMLIRTLSRLSRALNPDLHDAFPPTATVLEPVQNMTDAIGDFVLSMAYVAKDCLGIPFKDIARFNMAKLLHREQFGKENDITFDVTFLSENSQSSIN